MRVCEYCGSKSEANVCPNCGASMINAKPENFVDDVFSNIPPKFETTYSSVPKEKFHQKTWFIILMFFLFWPVGVACMWIHKKFPLAVRIIISVFFGLALIGSL